ncbi:MAG: nucleotidyltransferase domain-containing protein [Ectothiorhodospiraceae bacterium]|nr:nucleotidyltransferase domain-containing protein [Ectothiorhodospiraceae bacterium]
MNSGLAASGLPPETISKIQQVFADYPEIECVCLYGSRAKRDFRHGSDIDLSIMGDALSDAGLLRVEGALDNLLLPYKIDLCLFRNIENKDLVDHIQGVGIEFYRRNNVMN